MKCLLFSLFFLHPAALLPLQVSASEPANVVYELTTERAVSVLPEPLRSFYSRQLGDLKSKAKLPENWIASGDMTSSRPTLWLDLSAASGDRRLRLDSVKKFSRTESAPRGRPPLTDAIEEHTHALRDYFRSGTARHTPADETAMLIVLTTDAAMPFNTTSGAHFGATDAARFLDDHQARFQGELIRRVRKRLEWEVKIDPTRLKPTSRVADAVVDAATEAYQWIDPLLDIEAIVAEEIVAKSGEAIEKREERFLDELADRAYPILEARIEAGALLAANLIVGAWIEAGKPAVTDDAPTAATDPPGGSVTLVVETSRVSAFLGSKDSTVYHKSDCIHLARVKPENRVTFDDAKSAAAKGRKPCKTCKPDAPAPATVSP